MAACGGFKQIFEKPLSETPTFLESLSPWKNIKPIDDSSITEIFGELQHFKERHVDSSPSTSSNPTDAEEERGKGRASPSYNPPDERKQYRQRGESISSDGLSLCTEGLGFESSEDLEHDVCNSEWGDGDGERNVARNSHSENHRSEAVSRRRRALPPPISCIGRCGTPGVCFRSYKEGGRFILREVRIPTQEFLHACRQNGRLKLQFVHNDNDDDEILDEDQVEEYRIQEHHVESRD